MPFSHESKNPGDLIKSEDWNSALDAVVELFAKFNPTNGHQHSGSGEDAPPISTEGLADNAVVTAKIADNAVDNAKIANNAISGSKIQDGTIGQEKLSFDVNTGGGGGGGNNKQIGIAIGVVGHNQSIPIPNGYSRTECKFFASIKFINLPKIPAGTAPQIVVNDKGRVTTIPASTPNTTFVLAYGMAIGKKGGW